MDSEESILREWPRICQTYCVPSDLYPHQIDAMNMIKKGEHVLLGIRSIKSTLTINLYLAVPTGAGKSLPQLATILALEGSLMRFT